jgi:flagellar biosynthesis/type III secretory pathway chaperone
MSDDAHQRLEDLLDREIEVARALAATLNEERNALTGTSPADLEARAAAKMQLLGALERLEDERRALAHAAGQSLPGTRLDRPEGIAAGVAQRWRALMEIVSRCRSANEVNGYIINIRRGQVQQLLGAVRGVATTHTYSAQGKTLSTALRALAKA